VGVVGEPMTAQTGTEPTIAEDLLLLLFDPESGTFVGEGQKLFHMLAGAVIVDLAVRGLIDTDDRGFWRGDEVSAVGDEPPADSVLRTVWERVHRSPAEVQTLILEVGPSLRQVVIDRLVDRGELTRESRRLLGLIPSTVLAQGGTGRRDALLAPVRAALVEGADPDDRTGALAALLSAGGQLPSMHRDIPWSGAVHDHGKALENGQWGTAETAEAVRRTDLAQLVSTVALTVVVTTAT
jgi:hypothetical protein